MLVTSETEFFRVEEGRVEKMFAMHYELCIKYPIQEGNFIRLPDPNMNRMQRFHSIRMGNKEVIR